VNFQFTFIFILFPLYNTARYQHSIAAAKLGHSITNSIDKEISSALEDIKFIEKPARI